MLVSLGSLGEQKAASYLKGLDYKILQTNFHSRFGEIDIIAKNGNTTVFIEVKTRSNMAFGSPADAVSYHKMRKVIITAQFYFTINKLGNVSHRFDVIEVFMDNMKFSRLNHIQNVTL